MIMFIFTSFVASGKIRAAIGKANLLTSKKFKQFRGLCEQNLVSNKFLNINFCPLYSDISIYVYIGTM